MDKITKENSQELQIILDEITSAQEEYGLADEYIYKVATDETREEYFTRMLKLLKALHKDIHPELYGVQHG